MDLIDYYESSDRWFICTFSDLMLALMILKSAKESIMILIWDLKVIN